MIRWRMRRLSGAALVVTGVVLMSSTHAVSAAGSPVSGGGASFPQLELEQWRADTARKPYSLQFNYAASGSGAGRLGYLQGTFDYGVSDISFQPEDNFDPNGPRAHFVYVPVSAGGLAFMYNLIGSDGNRITSLKLTPKDACRVFTVPGIRWTDPSIVATNPGVPLPDAEIPRVVRSDSSGTTFILSAYCQTVAPDVWGTFVTFMTANDASHDLLDDFKAGRPVSRFPILSSSAQGAIQGAPGSDGVANLVAAPDDKNSITYVETGFAKVRSFPVASVQNAAGVYMQPDAPAVSAALAYATLLPDGTFSLKFATPDPKAYFPSTYSYVIAQTTGFDPNKGLTLATYLDYAVTKGQDVAEPLGYAHMSSILVNTALDRIVQIPGAPPRLSPGGAPPSTTPTTVSGGNGSAGGSNGGGGSGGDSGGGGSGGGSSGGSHSGGNGSAGGSNGGGSSGNSGGNTRRGGSTGTGTSVVANGGSPGAASGPTGASGSPSDTAGGPASSAVGSGDAQSGAITTIATSTTVASTTTTTIAPKAAPTNRQVLWTMLQGGVFVGVGLLLAQSRPRFSS